MKNQRRQLTMRVFEGGVVASNILQILYSAEVLLPQLVNRLKDTRI